MNDWPEEGSKAPDFTLQADDGSKIKLSSLRGSPLVLYFYPKDDTPGCTKQACNFADNYNAFLEKGVVVLGISKDSIASHEKFAEKYSLPFPILADPELKVIKDYDVWQEKTSYGKTSMGVVRTTYIIDEKGIIDYENVMKLKGKMTQLKIGEKLGISNTTVSRMLKPDYKPYKTSARYFSDIIRDKEWFNGV